MIDAKKNTLGGEEALGLAAEADHIYVAKGKNVVHFDMKKARPGDDTLLAAMLGPTGNLRAPTLRKGKTLIVGFDEATYQKVFG